MDVHRALELSNGDVMAAAELMAAAIGGKRPADEDGVTADAIQRLADQIMKQRDVVKSEDSELEMEFGVINKDFNVDLIDRNSHPSKINRFVQKIVGDESRYDAYSRLRKMYREDFADEDSEFRKAVLKLNEMENRFDAMQKQYYKEHYQRFVDTPMMAAVGIPQEQYGQNPGLKVHWKYVGDKYLFPVHRGSIELGLDTNFVDNYFPIEPEYFEMAENRYYMFFTPA